MFNEEYVKMCQENARKYSRAVAKQRRREKCKKVAIGVILSAFFITAFAIVGENDLESEGIVLAKETETVISPTHNLKGEIVYKNLIETEEGYLWKYDTKFPEGTEVIVLFNDNGTINPLDDVVLDVTKR